MINTRCEVVKMQGCSINFPYKRMRGLLSYATQLFIISNGFGN